MSLASTANQIHTGGGHLIFSSTAVGAGNWVPVHPGIRQISFQATLTGSSVGAPVQGTVAIQASIDGTNVISSTLGLITFSTTGVASPAVDGFAIDAHYNFIRAMLGGATGTTMSTGSSMQVVASPHNI